MKPWMMTTAGPDGKTLYGSGNSHSKDWWKVTRVILVLTRTIDVKIPTREKLRQMLIPPTPSCFLQGFWGSFSGRGVKSGSEGQG